MGTAYAVAFDGDRFLMVWNPRRGGWEMPGGHVEPGETVEEAVVRETSEEAGYRIRVVATRDLGDCHVCAAVVIGGPEAGCEMESGLFGELPAELSFDRGEYEDTVPWARSAIPRAL